MNYVLSLLLLYVVSGGVVIYTLINHAPTLVANFVFMANKYLPSKREDVKHTLYDYFIFLLLWPIVVLMIIYAENVFKFLNENSDEWRELIKDRETFADSYRMGVVAFKEIKVYLKQHKLSRLQVSEWDYLGITEEDYRQYLMNPDRLKKILDERNSNHKTQEPA